MTTLIATMMIAVQTTGLTFVPSGMTAKMGGGYSPVRAEFSEKGEEKVDAKGIKAPKFSTLVFGDKKYVVVLEEQEDGTSKLFVDSKQNGKLVQAKGWAPRKQGQSTMMFGSFEIEINGKMATVMAYKFDPKDAQRAALKNTVLYYADFGFAGKVRYGNEELMTAFTGLAAPNSRVFIDRNGNGKMDGRAEAFTMSAPFNLGGTSYKFALKGSAVSVEKSDVAVAEVPMPPDLSIGKLAPTFESPMMDGSKMSFPSAYKGKIVMLDFWATWCGPCIGELPNLIKGYEKYHGQGFEILSISLDQPKMADKVKSFTESRNMSWGHIYEGKYWDITLGKQYGVQAIPFCLLVDGDTGKILANVNELRGENLDKTLARVLSERKGK